MTTHADRLQNVLQITEPETEDRDLLLDEFVSITAGTVAQDQCTLLVFTDLSCLFADEASCQSVVADSPEHLIAIMSFNPELEHKIRALLSILWAKHKAKLEAKNQ